MVKDDRKNAVLGVNVEGTTRIVGIIGNPIDHTLSPRMHNAAFAELGLDFVYVPFRTKDRRLREAVRTLKVLGIAGFNVTVPYKEDVMRYLDRISETAQAVGAVNTIYRENRLFIGDNTDAAGFHQSLLAHDFRPRGKRVLVIGAGGSARAIVYALVKAGVSSIVIANRTLANARRLARVFDSHQEKIEAADLDVLDNFDFLATRQLVVNCTPVGLDGGDFLDYAPESTPAECVHFDLTYGEKPTPFLRLAAAAKRPTIDGRHMLVHQGALAFKIFTGRRAPVEAMTRAVGL